jgi:hypothetical protein
MLLHTDIVFFAFAIQMALWFDFNNPDMVKQATRVSTMEAWVEGQTTPTLVFAKARKARSVGQK